MGPLLLQASLVGSLVAHRGSRRSKTTSPPASFPSQSLALPRMSSGARGQGFGLGCRPSPLPNTQQCRKISFEDIFGAYCNDSPMFASAAHGARWLSPRGVTQSARHRAAPCLLHLPRCHRSVCKHHDSSPRVDLLPGVNSGSAASTLLPPSLPQKIPCPALLGCRRRPSPPGAASAGAAAALPTATAPTRDAPNVPCLSRTRHPSEHWSCTLILH